MAHTDGDRHRRAHKHADLHRFAPMVLIMPASVASNGGRHTPQAFEPVNNLYLKREFSAVGLLIINMV